jgi:Protein of unknown function (DUF732)
MQPPTIATALIASAAVLFSAAPAHADAQDDAYLNALGAHGLSTQYPPDKLIAAGHRACTYRSAGAAPWQTQDGLVGQGIAPQDVDAVVSSAISAYCP